jgi:hypothetical protein
MVWWPKPTVDCSNTATGATLIQSEQLEPTQSV